MKFSPILLLIFSLILGGPSHGFANDEWDLEGLEEIMAEIETESLYDDEVSPEVPSNEITESLFAELKAKAVKLANKVGVDLVSIKREATAIIQNLRSLDESGTVTHQINPEEGMASFRFHMDVDKDVADELGIDEKYELYEVQFLWDRWKDEK